MRTVAALYCLPDERCIYRTMPGVEVWDEARDARNYDDGMPVVAHPPCGPWGRMRQFCKGGDGLRELAPLAVAQVRTHGGVLEHPAHSTLWDTGMCMAKPGQGPDVWGGYTIEVDQFHWGHPCRKKTWLYIMGVSKGQLPPMPFRQGKPELLVAPSTKDRRAGLGRGRYLPKSQRSVTPRAFAEWLVEIARRSHGVGR